MYELEGDGSWQHTKVYRDGILIDYKLLQFFISAEHSWVIVDEVGGTIDRILLTGIYSIIGNGTYQGTRVLHLDDMLRGVQSFYVTIAKDKNPIIRINDVFLPTIIEVE